MPEAGSVPGAIGSPLRAVLFDAGGTLIHMPRTAEEILAELCHQLGFAISPDQAGDACRASEHYYSEHYLGFSGDQGHFWHGYHAAALESLGIDDRDGQKAAYLSHAFGRAGVWQPYPESVRACAQLRSAGLKLGVVSNGSATVRDLLDQARLLPFFDVVIASQALGVQKPDPRIFRAALEAVGEEPGSTLFVGDLYDVDVAGARAAGITPVLIDRDGGPERDCITVRSLDEIVRVVEKLQPGSHQSSAISLAGTDDLPGSGLTLDAGDVRTDR